jgi:hypothetical protein
MAREIFRKSIRLKSGHSLDIFFNPENNLLVVDKNRKDGLGGNEFVRVDVSKIGLPTKRQLMKVM